MRRVRNEPAPPHGGRECELIRAGHGGMYWRAADGLEVRLAAAEREKDTAKRRATTGFAPGLRAFFGGVFAR